MLRLARAFERRGEGTLTFVGDGPLREALEGRPRNPPRRARRRTSAVPTWIAARDVVCQPSLEEPFGLATLEAMASARSVVATTVGGPPEFVTPEAGVLVDPLDEDALASALSRGRGASRPEPRRPRGGRDPRRQAAGGSGGGDPPASRCEIGEPDLDERTDRLLEACLARDGERLLVGLAHLLGVDALLEPVVAR